ncbi:MAG: hypothetical protein HFF13_06675 [Angelakisella sp.]|jgi:hypothetical protein|nr:hypothetical protein [Angelakisella sp.]
MNIFQNAETFYGGESKEVAEVPLLSIFRLAKQIRLQLGPKGYLLDSYLDIVFQGLMSGSVSDVLEDGLNAAFDLQPSLLQHIVEGAKQDMPHPLYHWAQEVYEQNPSVKSFQEHRTRMYLLMALLGDKPLVSALSEFAAEQHSCLLSTIDIVVLRELYRDICRYVNESLMEELNRKLRRFQVVSLRDAFLQGYTNDLLYQLTWRDPESSKQIFQLLLDILPGEA